MRWLYSFQPRLGLRDSAYHTLPTLKLLSLTRENKNQCRNPKQLHLDLGAAVSVLRGLSNPDVHN